MLSLTRPVDELIRAHLRHQEREPFSYRAVGATQEGPEGCAEWLSDEFTIDHRRIQLGTGGEVFRRAQAALHDWQMFSLGWLELCWPSKPVEVGATVGVLVKLPVGWSLNLNRVVYVMHEPGDVERIGFAYGTLSEHVAAGEERFCLEWRHEDDSVWYELFAISRADKFIGKLGYPYLRLLQRRFARDSARALQKAVEGP